MDEMGQGPWMCQCLSLKMAWWWEFTWSKWLGSVHIPTQYVQLWEVHGSPKEIYSQLCSARRKHLKGYGTEEVIEFCVDFITDLNSIGVPESRHKGRLSGKGTLGKKAYIGMVWTTISSIKHTTWFCKTPPWWVRIPRNTRTLYDLIFRGSLRPGLCIDTWKLSTVGYENISWVTRLFMSNCTCCLGNYLGISWHSQGTR
jgi:hypothetical protein